eukprot:10257302-Alexandrium_andersonii.AAC.1
MGEFRVVARADSESALESGPRGGPRSRDRELAGSSLQFVNPQARSSERSRAVSCARPPGGWGLSLIHISEPTRLALI